MKRRLLAELIAWQKKPIHLPLLLRGARQVGKSFLVEYFGQHYFQNTVVINFEQSPEYSDCFATLKPHDILHKIEILSGQSIIPGQSLLFLDEIQICPNAIMALRYFKEQMPELHVIGAGSLLEFALGEKGFHMPVGRVQYLYLKPLSFQEYLQAKGLDKLQAFIHTATLDTDIPDAIHDKALQMVQEYMAIGGMPMVVEHFIQNQSLRECQEYQTLVLKTYSDDFAKYADTAHHKYLQQVYDRTPGLVGQQIKYVNISANMDSRYLKEAIHSLSKAGVITPIYASLAAGLPLISHVQEKKFKLLFLDIGLLKRASRLDIDLLLNPALMLNNRGALTEQFVGQELLAYQDPYDEAQLYYWCRDKKGSSAEVDYLSHVDSQIIPIEVKSGKTGRLKSLQILLQEKSLPLGIRISTKKLQRQGNILSIPFYMIAEIARLVSSVRI